MCLNIVIGTLYITDRNGSGEFKDLPPVFDILGAHGDAKKMKTILRPSGEQHFLRDALRDLIVVVVGILAALYLESWWQDRQDRAEEALLLAGLRAEFADNRQQLVERISIWSDIREASLAAQRLMGRSIEDLGAELVRSSFRATMGMRFYDPRTGQLSSLISSGKLGLIRNAELRAKMADWPSFIEDLEVEREGALRSLMVTLGPHLQEFILIGPPGGPFEDRLEALLSDRRIYNDLGLMADTMVRTLREGNEILAATDNIIAMIDTELEDSR